MALVDDKMKLRLVIISDTHEQHEQVILPEGDVLIHCGDMTFQGSIGAIGKAITWLKNQPFEYKVVVSGNHDMCFRNANRDIACNMMREAEINYLQDSWIKLYGLVFYGSPWQPIYTGGWAFELSRGKALADKWRQIPEATNVLITHSPSHGTLDLAPRDFGGAEHCGCEELAKRVKQLPNLKLHCHGHIHHSYGMIEQDGVKIVNASSCNEQYKPVNKPIVVELET